MWYYFLHYFWCSIVDSAIVLYDYVDVIAHLYSRYEIIQFYKIESAHSDCIMFKHMYNAYGGLIISALDFADVSRNDYAIKNGICTIIPKFTLNKLFPDNINDCDVDMFIIPNKIVIPSANASCEYFSIATYPIISQKAKNSDTVIYERSCVRIKFSYKQISTFTAILKLIKHKLTIYNSRNEKICKMIKGTLYQYLNDDKQMRFVNNAGSIKYLLCYLLYDNTRDDMIKYRINGHCINYICDTNDVSLMKKQLHSRQMDIKMITMDKKN
jgi:hypothetical protein